MSGKFRPRDTRCITVRGLKYDFIGGVRCFSDQSEDVLEFEGVQVRGVG